MHGDDEVGTSTSTVLLSACLCFSKTLEVETKKVNLLKSQLLMLIELKTVMLNSLCIMLEQMFLVDMLYEP